jgi:hypothetical protein
MEQADRIVDGGILKPTDTGGWGDYQRLVLYRLDDLAREQKVMQAEVTRLNNQLITWKVYLSIFAAVGSILISVATSLITAYFVR